MSSLGKWGVWVWVLMPLTTYSWKSRQSLVVPAVKCWLKLCVSPVLDTGPTQLFAGCRGDYTGCGSVLAKLCWLQARLQQPTVARDLRVPTQRRRLEKITSNGNMMKVCIMCNINQQNPIYLSESTWIIFHDELYVHFWSSCRVRGIGSQVWKIGQLAKRWLEWVQASRTCLLQYWRISSIIE